MVVSSAMYFFIRSTVSSQSLSAKWPVGRFSVASVFIRPMPTLSWASDSSVSRSALTFWPALIDASGSFIAASKLRTVALTKRRTRSGFSLMRSVWVKMVSPTVLVPYLE